MTLGGLLFSFSLVGISPHDKFLGGLGVAAGLLMALMGVARFVAKDGQRGTTE